jgi:hypothetical protein
MLHHHHHKRKHHYSFKNFTHDISQPFMKVEKDVVGVYHHGISAFEKVGSSFGSSIGIPLIIVGGAVIIYIVANKGKM